MDIKELKRITNTNMRITIDKELLKLYTNDYIINEVYKFMKGTNIVSNYLYRITNHITLFYSSSNHEISIDLY